MNIRNKKTILLIISIIILILLIIGLYLNYLSFIDDVIYKFIIGFKTPFLTFFFNFITFFASIEWLVIISIIILLFCKERKLKIGLLIYLLGIALITLLLKNIFIRERPFELMIIFEDGYSFPSGHSSSSMAFYGLLSYLIYKSKLVKYKKVILISSLILLILLIGISRIYLGVHYPSDVLAGFMVGLIYFIMVIYIYNLRKR